VVKVMITDDHLMVREGLKQLLAIGNDIEVIAEAHSGLECLHLLESLSPDVILMDIKMPGISGIETTRLICQRYPYVKIIMLTIYGDGQFVAEALHAGAKGYILKNVEREELVKAIRHVVENGAFLDPAVTPTVLDHFKSDKILPNHEEGSSLTQRELEVLKGIVAGHTDRKIAESLFISKHTVRTHIKSLYRKLNASSKSQAVARAMHDGIVIADN
jgi:DNA-binding NarL/FixJ family response regulator